MMLHFTEPSSIDWSGALDRAETFSAFLSGALGAFPMLADLLRNGEVDEAWDLIPGLAGDEGQPLARRLRIERRARALVIAIADLAGAWPLEDVSGRLSAFADEAADRAIAAAFEERYPGEAVRGFALLGLGKHGSGELNYSSDIDPILLFDPATLPHGAREEPVEAAVRIARRFVALLSERDADGYVFRVDLRLRPSPDASPIALPVGAAISYYESSAAGWEQAAFIRARAAAGDRQLGEDFLAAIRPFVWRRSLDFGAVEAITGITRRIRDHYAEGQRLGPGFDVKRGRGGIREVEFFAQIHQLIHGGRNPAVRAPATMDALAALAEAEIVERETADALSDAYRLLRTVEHRLQMVDDRQTHSLPTAPESLDGVAGLAGLADGAALVAALEPVVGRVAATFDVLSHDDRESEGQGTAPLPVQPDELGRALRDMGFADPVPIAARIGEWRDGQLRVARSPAARAAMEPMLPQLLPILARAPDPQAAMLRLDALLRGLSSAINIFRLLAARPGLAEIVVDILSHAPALAEALGQRAALLDGLIDASAFDPMPPVAALADDFARVEADQGYEGLLDSVRQKVGERRFAIGVQILRGEQDPIECAAGYGRVAEAAIEVLTRATIVEFEAAHGRVPGSELTILALGRLGGGLLTHASDLDLVFLFSGEFGMESDGPRPLGATQYFNRLAQRVTNALSVRTAAGPLYEVDTRLRPSGPQGLLAVNFDSFRRYQREAAWAWEHLALTRARAVFGSPAARKELGAIIDEVLLAERDGDALAGAAVTMRADIARHKKPRGDLDVKLAPGGLIDLEFLVHVSQFRHRGAFFPDLRAAIDALVADGVLTPDLRAAHDLLTRYLVVSRLVAPGADAPAAETQALVARVCGARDWPDLLARIADARHRIGGAWGAVTDQYGENRHA